MINQVPRKKHARLNVFIFKRTDNLFSFKSGILTNCEKKPEPAWLRIFGSLRQYKHIGHRVKIITKILPVLFAPGGKRRKLFKLLNTDGCLHFGRLQVIAQMRIHVFVIVTLGEQSVLPVKAVMTGIILTGSAAAVTSPVAKRFDKSVQQCVIGIHGTALSHSHMVRRVKAGCSDIADCTGEFIPFRHFIDAAKCITVILDQPQTVLFAKGSHSPQVERIAKRMRRHNRLGLRSQGSFKHRHVKIISRKRNINKNGNRSILQDRGNRCRESAGNRYDFIARQNAAFFERRRRKRHESQ